MPDDIGDYFRDRIVWDSLKEAAPVLPFSTNMMLSVADIAECPVQIANDVIHRDQNWPIGRPNG
jgi:hypothetical protein